MWNARLRPLSCSLRLKRLSIVHFCGLGIIYFEPFGIDRLLRMLICTKDVVERYTDHICHELSTSHDAQSAIKELLTSGKPCSSAMSCAEPLLERTEWACYSVCSEAVG